MSWFNNLGIQAKILGGFALTVVALGLAVLLTVRGLQSANRDTDFIYNTNFKALAVLDEAKADLILAEKDSMDALVAAEYHPEDLQSVVVESDAYFAGAQTALTALRAFVDPETRAIVDRVVARMTQQAQVRSQVFALLASGDSRAGIELNEGLNGNSGVDEFTAQNLDDMTELTSRLNQSTASAYQGMADSASRAKTLSITVALCAAAVSLGIGFYIARRIKRDLATLQARLVSIETKCLSFLQKGIQAVENGDLTVDAQPATEKIDKYGKDELGEMSASVNRMLDKLIGTMGSYNAMRRGLSTIVGGVRQNAASILDSSNSLRESSDQMASATG